MQTRLFEIQGHRGARARRPENTLPSFEAAIDAGVDSIEADIRLSSDGVWVIHHDPCLRGGGKRVDQFIADELNTVVVADNPDLERFPLQRAERTPLSESFARRCFPPPNDPYTIPTLSHSIAFLTECSNRVILDLEIKSEPRVAPIAPVQLESLADLVVRTKMVSRCRVRSFDHPLVKEFRRLLPMVETGVLVADVVPADPVRVTIESGAAVYCPEYRLLTKRQLEELHQADLRVIPWTVNDSADWDRLIDWGVDGLTTDDPAALWEWIEKKGNTMSPKLKRLGLIAQTQYENRKFFPSK